MARRYDRLASIYGAISFAFLLRPTVRRAAVERLKLVPGGEVLEVGCGRGDNLGLLRQAIGRQGRVVGTDLSAGMLERAERLCVREGWQNVELLQQDADRLDVGGRFDAVLFSLSYSVLRNPQQTLAVAWSLLRDGGQLVVMDAGLPENRAGGLLDRATRALSRASVLGDPSTRPWRDLAEVGAQDVGLRWKAPGTYFICWGTKRA